MPHLLPACSVSELLRNMVTYMHFVLSFFPTDLFHYCCVFCTTTSKQSSVRTTALKTGERPLFIVKRTYVPLCGDDITPLSPRSSRSGALERGSALMATGNLTNRGQAPIRKALIGVLLPALIYILGIVLAIYTFPPSQAEWYWIVKMNHT